MRDEPSKELAEKYPRKYAKDVHQKTVGSLAREVCAIIEDKGDYRAYLNEEFIFGAWGFEARHWQPALIRDIGSLVKFAYLRGKGEV